MKKFKVLWHEPSNFMCMVDPASGGLPLLTICDDRVRTINPYYAYPLEILLQYYGFIEIGEL